MPLVTIHTTSQEQTNSLKPNLRGLKILIAKELSGGSRNLAETEVSVRIIESDYAEPISQVEIMITAFSYPERIQNQDRICLKIKAHLEQGLPKYSFFVWLQLSELGHSIDEG